MCKISNRLILCSCDTEIDYDKDHWMLNRFREGKEDIIEGMPMLPTFLDPDIDKYNIGLLTEMLNQGNCFDFEVEFRKKDQLVLFLKCDNDNWKSELFYAFEFTGGKWREIETEPLMLNWYHDTIREVRIKNSFETM